VTSAQVIVLAAPVFLVLIALEAAWGWRTGRNTYQLPDAMSSIVLGMLSQVSGLFVKLLAIGLYVLAYEHLALWQLSTSDWWVWMAALIGYDFLYYWHHRAGHRIAVFWAAHVVHHQSEAYNLSTALRQTSSGAVLGWVFYLPLALLGVPPLVFGIVALIDLLYQFWVHTQHVGKLGWFDRWFCAPSNHRVHHAVNERYLDRNYGGILILWDRCFGTYAEERDDERIVYGTRAPLRSLNPLWANLEVYAALWQDSWHTRRWADKLKVWFKPPGWRPQDVRSARPKPAFDLGAWQAYEPRPGRTALALAAVLFWALLALTAALLWWQHQMPLWQTALGALLLWAGAWTLAALCGGARVRPKEI
jgi:alkylglycerol monooxygenase